jgi:PKD repeat protein
MKPLKITLLTLLLLPLAAIAQGGPCGINGVCESDRIGISLQELNPCELNETCERSIYAYSYYEDIGSCEWSIAGGSLPSGLNISSGYSGSRYCDGKIYGNPTETGTFNFTVKVNSTNEDSATRDLSIRITDAPEILTESPLYDGEVGVSYSKSFYATSNNLTWSITQGSLPPGLSLDDYGYGYIEGTPATEGSYTFTVGVTNNNSGKSSSKSFSITISMPDQPQIGRDELASGSTGYSYSVYMGSYNYTWSIVQGSLPPGLELNGNYIEGTPTTAGSYAFTVRATNASGTVRKEFIIDIYSGLQITTNTLQEGEVDIQYAYAHDWGCDNYGSGNIWLATTVSDNYSDFGTDWSMVSGSLPNGLYLHEYGCIYGTPTEVGTFSFTVQADVSGRNADYEWVFLESITKELSIKINPPNIPPPEISYSSLPANGMANEEYDGMIVSYGAGNKTWSIAAGSLPPGLEFEGDGNYCFIYGFPTTAGSYTFTVRVTNVVGYDEKEYTIVIETPTAPVITTNSLYGGMVNEHYDAYIGTSSSSNAIWSIAAGSLPPGLALTRSSGTYTYIEGIPTTLGTYTFTVKAENAAGSSTKEYTIAITAQTAPIIHNSNLSNGTRGQEYYSWLNSSSESAVWSLTTGSLPPGLELSNQGRISGIPTTVGTYTFTVKAENAVGSATREFTIVIEVPTAPAITTYSLPNGTANESYHVYIEARSNSNVTWSLAAGSLMPSGLDFNEWGSVSGTPATAGSYTFTVRATNAVSYAEKEFTLVIAAQTAPVITTNSLPGGARGEHYSYELNSSSESAVWSIATGSLPPGLEIDNEYSHYYRIFGTPTTIGTYTFTLKAENAAGSTLKQFTITIVEPIKPSFITKTLPNGRVGEDYWERIYLVGSRAECSVVEGSLPPSRSNSNHEIYSSDGYCGIDIYNTLTTAGTYTFKIKAENAAGSAIQSFTIVVDPPIVPVVTTTSLRNGEVGIHYYNYLRSTPNSEEWTLTGSLPPGLNLDYDGEIQGTPTTAGTFSFSVTAKNAAGSSVAKTLSITIGEAKAPTIITDSLPNGEVGAYYGYYDLEVSSSVTLSIAAGNLPPGLELYSGSNYLEIYGYPTTAGTYTFTMKAENANGSSTKQFTITIAAPVRPTITTASLHAGEIGYAYTAIIEPLSRSAVWSIAAGSLPPGLSIDDDDGVIYGTPVEKGIFTFTVKAENAAGSVTKQFTITILDAAQVVTITTTALPNGLVGTDYGFLRLESTSPSAIWTLESGEVPPGLRSYSGYIYGIPTTAGTYTFTLKAENENDSDSKQFTMIILDEPAEPREPIEEPPIEPIISLPQIAGSQISVKAIGSVIMLENLPNNAKVQIYNLQGKRIYSANSANSQILQIPVQTKGMYVVKIGKQSFRVAVR